MSVSRSELLDAVASAFRVAAPSRQELLLEAQLNEAESQVVQLVASLPDQRFDDVRAVWAELPELSVH